MADDTSVTAQPKKIRRVQIGFNVLVQVSLILFLAVMVNYLGFEHYRRWDFSRDRKYELSDKTKRFLSTIKGKVRATIFFSPDNPILTDVQNLLTEYQYSSRGKIDVETIDVQRNLARAKEILDKYKIVSNESLLILEYNGQTKSVKASEMADTDPGNPILGEPEKITAFKGEQAITAAFMDLVEGKKNILGYITGHKEPAIGKDSPIALLQTFIENENVKFQELNLFEVPTVPKEIETILIAGPQYDFSERELKLLRDFWARQGRILLLIDPAAQIPRLQAFLNELGVKVNDDRLMAMVRTGIEEIGLLQDVQARFLPGNPVTKRLADARAIFPGGASSLTLEPDRVRGANIKLEPLLQAEKGYWAEPDYRTGDQVKYQEHAAKAPNTPLTLAASVEKGGSGDDRVQVNSARLVVITNALFIQDAALRQGQQALDFVSASVNWLMNREQLIGIAPKMPQLLSFTLDSATLHNLNWIVLALMPLVPAIIGFLVWWRRRA